MARLRQRNIILHVTRSKTEIFLAAKSFTTLAKRFSEIEHAENSHEAKLLQPITALLKILKTFFNFPPNHDLKCFARVAKLFYVQLLSKNFSRVAKHCSG